MQVLDFIRHLDDHIGHWIHQFGPWSYGILFLIVFAETGFVITPFLPGDSLLFAAGMFAVPAKNGFNVWILLLVLTLAPLCGDTVNYHLGKWLGPKVFKSDDSKFLKKKHLLATQKFFAKHGPKAVIIARWVPIVRTFAPFVAGMGSMEYRRFFGYSVLGAFLWVWICIWAGYFLGAIPVVEQNFEYGIMALIGVSLIPIVIEWRKHRQEAAQEAELAKAAESA